MITLINHPDAALQVARHTIADRVDGAGGRARMRALRNRRRSRPIRNAH